MRKFFLKFKWHFICFFIFNIVAIVVWLVLYFLLKNYVNWNDNEFFWMLLIVSLLIFNTLYFFFTKKFLVGSSREDKLIKLNVENEYEGWLSYKDWNNKNELFKFSKEKFYHQARPVILETLFVNQLDIDKLKRKIRRVKLNKYDSYKEIDFNEIDNKKNNQIFFRQSPEEHSVLCIGIPGTGKTALFLIPSISANLTSLDKPSMTIIDVKGELFEATAKLAKDNGYDVIKIDTTEPYNSHRINPLKIILDFWQQVIDFKKITKIINSTINNEEINSNELINTKIKKSFEDKSLVSESFFKSIKSNINKEVFIIDNEVEFEKLANDNEIYIVGNIIFSSIELLKRNSMRYQKTYVEKSDKEIEYAAQLIMSDFFKNSGSDKFWPESAKILLKSVMKLARFEYQLNLIKKEHFNFFYICNKTKNMNVTTYNNLTQVLIEKDYDIKNDEDWIKFISESSKSFTEGKTFDSILMSAYTAIENFSEQWIGLISSKNEIELTNIFTKPTILYLIFSESEKNRSKFCCYILDLIWRLVEETARKYPKKKLPKNLFMYNDEFGNISFMNSAEPSVTLGRGFGVRAVFFIQDFDQLQKIYSKETANIIFSSCKTRIFLGSKNEDTIRKFSDGFGTIKKKRTSVSDGDKKSDKSYSSNFEDKPIVNKNTLLNLPMGKAVLWIENSKPFLTQLTKPWLADFFNGEKGIELENINIENISNDFYENSEKPLIVAMRRNFEKEEEMKSYDDDIENKKENLSSVLQEEQIDIDSEKFSKYMIGSLYEMTDEKYIKNQKSNSHNFKTSKFKWIEKDWNFNKNSESYLNEKNVSYSSSEKSSAKNESTVQQSYLNNYPVKKGEGDFNKLQEVLDKQDNVDVFISKKNNIRNFTEVVVHERER